MFSVVKDWNPKHSLLRSIIQKEDRFDEYIKLIYELHSMVHTCEVYSKGKETLEDDLWDGLDLKACSMMPTPKDTTIAWNIWHITRIEDLIVNILIDNEAQELNIGKWHAKLNVDVMDTGNAMSVNEIIDFSSKIDIYQLRNYRIAVGKRSRDIFKKLNPSDFKSKVQPNRLNRILDEGGVLDVEGSKWLLDFWGRKNIAGLILMPITRHQIVHLNDSMKIKEKCIKNRQM